MHFRSRGHVVQLIRTTYDAETKRAKSQVVGRVPRSTLALNDDLSSKLTPDERRDFDAFALNYLSSTKLQGKVYAFQLPDIVRQVIEAADEANDPESALIESNLTAAAQEIRAYLSRKAKSAA